MKQNPSLITRCIFATAPFTYMGNKRKLCMQMYQRQYYTDDYEILHSKYTLSQLQSCWVSTEQHWTMPAGSQAQRYQNTSAGQIPARATQKVFFLSSPCDELWHWKVKRCHLTGRWHWSVLPGAVAGTWHVHWLPAQDQHRPCVVLSPVPGLTGRGVPQGSVMRQERQAGGQWQGLQRGEQGFWSLSCDELVTVNKWLSSDSEVATQGMKVDRRKLFTIFVMRKLSVLFVLFVLGGHGVGGADLVIRIPGDLSQQDGFYRLNYRYSHKYILCVFHVLSYV